MESTSDVEGDEVKRRVPAAVQFVNMLMPGIDTLYHTCRTSGEFRSLMGTSFTWNGCEWDPFSHMELLTSCVAGCLSHNWPINREETRRKLAMELSRFLDGDAYFAWAASQGEHFPNALKLTLMLHSCRDALLRELNAK